MRALTFAFALVPVLTVAAPIKATIKEIVLKPEKFDGKEVIVQGKVKAVLTGENSLKKPFFAIKITDGKGELAVFGRVKLAKIPKKGDKVEAFGTFGKEVHSGGRIFMNEIQILREKNPKHDVKVIK